MKARLAVAQLLVCSCGAAEQPVKGDWRDELIYQIVVDRFDNADPSNDQGVITGDLARHQGGDWAGIRRRLGYLSRMGVTAIWISPVVKNVDRVEIQDGYHGYWASDFNETNPRFGSLEELQALVRDAHAQGIKVIVDVVTNHTGRLFFYDLDRDGELDDGEEYPPYSGSGAIDAPVVWTGERPRLGDLLLAPEHFHRRGQFGTSDQVERELGDFPTGLRDLDTESEVVIEALIETYLGWVERTDIDGFRLDAVPHVSRTFWARFCSELRRRLVERLGKEQFMLLGEVFNPDPEVLASYVTPGQFDAVFDFSLKWEGIDAVLLDGAPTASALGPLQSYRSAYPDAAQENGLGLTPWEARVSFADNHDMWRIAAEIDDPRVVALALTMVFTVDAIPAVYYGTEQGFVGTGGDSTRERLWISNFREDTFEYGFIAHLANLRKNLPALRYGDLTVRYASTHDGVSSPEEDAGMLAYERAYGEQRVLVAINTHASRGAFAAIPTLFGKGSRLVDLLFAGDREYRVGKGGALELFLEPRSAVVLVEE